jgi:hypothetical protein
MAKSIDNILLKGASGTIGGILTFTRKRSGKIVMGKKRIASKGPLSESRKEVMRKFKLGVLYAKTAILDPVRKAFYAAVAGPDQSAFNMALKDAIKGPEVTSITAAAYRGQAGDAITIRAIDDFKVVSVRVSIYTATGTLVEVGNAVQQTNGLDWLYQATTENDELAGSVITAIAVDTPGNEATLEVVV